MESFDYNKKSISLDKNKSRCDDSKTYYFPSLARKDLVSLNNMKHQIYYKSRAKKQKNFFSNFHTEVLKTNIKDNSVYLSLYNNNISKQTAEEFKFPDLRIQKKIKKDKIIKLYTNPNTISDFNKDIINNSIKINYKNIFKINKPVKKFDISNISTNGNLSLSINSYKLSKLNKAISNSIDFKNISSLNANRYANNSINTFNDNSFEQKVNVYTSNNTTPSINNFNKYKIFKNENNNLTTSYSNNTSFVNANENIHKKFLTDINPIYALLNKEFLREFIRKTKDISYLKYIFNEKKMDIETKKEKRIAEVEKQDLDNYYIKMISDYFNKFHDSKYKYINYLKKFVTKEKEKNARLKEDKISIINDIFTIRHKTLRLENRFRNYLNDKFFLLSVKNHAFSLNKFSQEDQEDYNNDLKKLDILNLMIKVAEKEFEKDNDNEKSALNSSRRNSKILIGLSKNNNNTNNKVSSLFSNNKTTNKNFRRRSTLILSNKYSSLYGSKPILSSPQKKLIKTSFKASPIYDDPYDFNRDLQYTSNNIQYSLGKYNTKSMELQDMRNQLQKYKLEMSNIKQYEEYINTEIIIHKKNLENLKALNANLQDYKNYLSNIEVLNLNKSKVSNKIRKIIKNIENSKDEVLLEYIDNLKRGPGKMDLIILERAINFLLNFREIQKENNSKKYRIIEGKIQDINRIKISLSKKEKLIKKEYSLIEKVINKNKKVIYVSRRKVNIGFNHEKSKKKKIIDIKNSIFGEFDLAC